LPQIAHVVVVMMENHSYDNYLGMLARGDGLTRGPDGSPTNANPADEGTVRAFHLANTCQVPGHPNQGWNATHAQWNGGAMDGFVRSQSGAVAMGYWDASDLPFYYGLASTFPVCDRWFASCMAQTFPNRRFLLAATAQGTIATDDTGLRVPPPPNGTIVEALNRHGISWRNYFSDLPSLGLYLPVLGANGDKVVEIGRFFSDAAAGSLPAFSLVDPRFSVNSEENPPRHQPGGGVRPLGGRRRAEGPGMAVDLAGLAVRRARRLLRPCGSPAGRRPRRRAAEAGPG
jgi:phospholipase C